MAKEQLSREEFEALVDPVVAGLEYVCDDAYAAKVDEVSAEQLQDVIQRIETTISQFNDITSRLVGGQLEDVEKHRDDSIAYMQEMLPVLKQKLDGLSSKN
ncbi:MAG: hypothetical protein OEX11_09375 [Nitrosomonas sp.]|nr:hypothetical protein [Nitrosomonas sp.]